MDKNNNSVLLVEDNKKHMEDAKRVLDKFEILYDPVFNLADALGFFVKYSTNGILSDVFFPISRGGVERLSSVILCEYALEQYVPIVLCTSTYHHGSRTSQVNRYAKRQGIPLVDSEDVMDDEEADAKDWDKAVLELLIQQAIMENREFSSQRDRLNELVLQGDVYSNDNPTYSTCRQIAEEVIQTVSGEYGIDRSISVDDVTKRTLMKLPNFAENHGSCQPYRIDLVAYEY